MKTLTSSKALAAIGLGLDAFVFDLKSGCRIKAGTMMMTFNGRDVDEEMD